MYNGSRKDNTELEDRIKNMQSQLDKINEEYRSSTECLEKEHQHELIKVKEAMTQVKVELD